MLSQIMSLPLFQIVQSLQISLRAEAKFFSSCKVLQDLNLIIPVYVTLAASATLATSIFLALVKPALMLASLPLLFPEMPFSQTHLPGLFSSFFFRPLLQYQLLNEAPSDDPIWNRTPPYTLLLCCPIQHLPPWKSLFTLHLVIIQPTPFPIECKWLYSIYSIKSLK